MRRQGKGLWRDRRPRGERTAGRGKSGKCPKRKYKTKYEGEMSD